MYNLSLVRPDCGGSRKSCYFAGGIAEPWAAGIRIAGFAFRVCARESSFGVDIVLAGTQKPYSLRRKKALNHPFSPYYFLLTYTLSINTNRRDSSRLVHADYSLFSERLDRAARVPRREGNKVWGTCGSFCYEGNKVF
jgi:hypothetical protein